MADKKNDDPAQQEGDTTPATGTPETASKTEMPEDADTRDDAAAGGPDTADASDAASDAAPNKHPDTAEDTAGPAVGDPATGMAADGPAPKANPWSSETADTGSDTLSTGDSPLASGSDDRLEHDETPRAAQPVPQPEPRRGGFVPLVLGGVIAAGLGFGAAVFGQGSIPFLSQPDPFEDEARAALEEQGARLDTLAADLDTVQASVGALDTSPIADGLAALDTRLTEVQAAQGDLADRLAAIDDRLTALERAPVEEAVSPEAIAAYEREIEALRQSVSESRAEIEAIAEAARQSENSAARQAELAESRAALADVAAALQAGQGFDDAVATLRENGVAVPEPLAGGADGGVPTPAELLSEFPDAARDALRVAREVAPPEGDTGGLGAFLRTQLGARSVTPRAGDDADAVLSRAEAALRTGDLDTVLAEIETLPEAAQAEMADWVAMARTRRDAVAATGALARELNE